MGPGASAWSSSSAASDQAPFCRLADRANRRLGKTGRGFARKVMGFALKVMGFALKSVVERRYAAVPSGALAGRHAAIT